MSCLLVINSSGRHNRSITRRLVRQFSERWIAAHPDARVVERDLALHPPTPVDEAWIAAAFADAHSGAMPEALAESETLLAEIEAADAIVIGVPMYNFGTPAVLKAYFDQIIRVGRSFAFDASADEPYRPLLADKPTTLVMSLGDGDILPGGRLARLNFLEPHLLTMLGFIGIRSVDIVRVGYEEFQDGRLKRAIDAAEALVDRLASSTVGIR